MEYIIYVTGSVTKYVKQTSIPLNFTTDVKEAFEFENIRAGNSYLDFLRHQGINTTNFHLGQKPPK